jgi:adenylosuccinate synthase
MKSVAFIGAQSDDEGKGVRVAYYANLARNHLQKIYGDSKPHILVMRWQRGANAGHTLFSDGKRYALHQLPSGIILPGTFNLMAEGVYFNPRKAKKEIEDLRMRGVKINQNNFGISSNSHVTLDYHVDLDDLDSLGRTGHTSTGNGIKPTAVDKQARVGIRFEEFLDRTEFIEALKKRFPDEMPQKYISYEHFADSYVAEMEALSDLSVLQTDVLRMDSLKVLIGEGAQGFQLDVDRGAYPGVTSSNPSIVPFRTDSIVGVVKMYESSVGGGRPFVGRMNKNLETRLRESWKEFGTTTGKPRNLGWIDIVELRNAIDSSEIDFLIGTCGDRLQKLTKFGEKVKMIVAYEIEGKKFEKWDKSFHKRRNLYQANPIFEEFDAWDKFYDPKTKSLTQNAQKFVNRIEHLTNKKFIAHGYGPEIDDVLDIDKGFILDLVAGKLYEN